MKKHNYSYHKVPLAKDTYVAVDTVPVFVAITLFCLMIPLSMLIVVGIIKLVEVIQ